MSGAAVVHGDSNDMPDRISGVVETKDGRRHPITARRFDERDEHERVVYCAD